MMRSKPISDWWWSSHWQWYHGPVVVVVGWPHMTILHYLTPVPSLLVSLALLLLLLDPVPLILTPGIMGWRATIDQLVQQPVLTTPTVLPRPEHREVRLQRLQQFVHHITSSLGTLIPEGVMVTTLATTMMMSPSMMMSVSTVWPGARSSVCKYPIVKKLLVMWMKSTSSDCCKNVPFMVFTVRTVGRIDQQ